MNTPTPQRETAAQPVRPCIACGSGPLRPSETPITRKRRVKFGAGWLLATFVTGGVALLAYLVWPREDETIGIDRFLVCSSCGIRQP